ncbi:MAG: SDR family NAD(P)-dependent oxidoreductase [Lewinella sp.]|nr:SDR family NAD(P)-dependent oxidoreductase [Lewinella sp.]
MNQPTESFALITGASGGLGQAFALECARRGKSLILLALPDPRLPALARHLADQYGVRVIVRAIDLTDGDALDRTLRDLAAHYRVDWLINNAGIGGTARFSQAPADLMDQIIQLNIRSTVMLTRAFLPGMLQRNSGLILNVSSIAAFAPVAYKTVYPASKTFILAFSQGLQEEYRSTGLQISVLHPGAILTNFNTAHRVMAQGWLGRQSALMAGQIARGAVAGALRGRTLMVPGRVNQLQYYLARLLPTRLYLALSSAVVRRELQATATISSTPVKQVA